MNTVGGFDHDISHLLNADDWPLRWQRKLGLAPRHGMGLKRRALFFAVLTWLPMAAWAFLRGHALPGTDSEPLLAHFGVNIRCLLAIPLMILSEGMLLSATINMTKQFVRNGIVTPAQHPALLALLQAAARRRDASLPWIVVLGLTLTWVIADPANIEVHGLSWAVEGGSLGFGGWWFAYVARPVFIVLLAGWLWRIVLAFLLFHSLSKLDLSLVASHPDRAGGIGFLEYYPRAFFLLTFAISAVIASGWAHEAVYHAKDVHEFIKPLAALAILWSLILLSPMLVFMPKLAAAKRLGKLEYSRVVGEHGRLVHQRWILNQAVPDEGLLDAPGIGPVADANTMYDAVVQMRVIPINKAALMSILLPLAVPMLVLFATQIPLKELLTTLLKAVI